MGKDESSKSGSKDGIPSSGAELQYGRKQQREDGKFLCVARGIRDSKITSSTDTHIFERHAKVAYLLLLNSTVLQSVAF